VEASCAGYSYRTLIGMRQWLTKKITRERLDAFLKSKATNKRVLDLGSSWSPYAKYFPNRVTCDINPGEGVDVVADAHDLPFKDAEFEVVVCSEVLEHLHTPEKAIAEMRRVLKKDGTLILTTRFMFPIHEAPFDYFRYTEYGLRHLFRDWDVQELKAESKNIETVAILLHRMAFTMRFKGGTVTRFVVYLIAKCIAHLAFFVKSEYSTLKRNEPHIAGHTFASGYYMVARRR
jgi:SAM-dependent methyltransferase